MLVGKRFAYLLAARLAGVLCEVFYDRRSQERNRAQGCRADGHGERDSGRATGTSRSRKPGQKDRHHDRRGIRVL